MNDVYIYVFVRQDISIEFQLVHSNHAVLEMARQFPSQVKDVIPGEVLVGMPNLKALNKVITKLQENTIDYIAWDDSPFLNIGTLAVATVPLSGDIRKVFANYRLYQASLNS